jgi:uncharacterized protein YggU (UPF0235/DUF167 family)
MRIAFVLTKSNPSCKISRLCNGPVASPGHVILNRDRFSLHPDSHLFFYHPPFSLTIYPMSSTTPLRAAIRLSTKPIPCIQLFLRVKPGVSPLRQGIASITHHWINVNVTSRAQDGAANKAVTQLLASMLRVPKNAVTIVKGEKSSEKVVAVEISAKRNGEDDVEYVRGMLEENVMRRREE